MAMTDFTIIRRSMLSRLFSTLTTTLTVAVAVGLMLVLLSMRDAGEDFSDFCWGFTGGKPVQNRWTAFGQVPAQTELAVEVSKALKAKGFKFVCPVIVYAWMQAVGMVNDHMVSCFRHQQVQA